MKAPPVVARHRAAVIVAVVVVGIAVVTFAVIRAGGGGSNRSATPTTPTTPAPSGPTAELVALVRRSQAVNVDVAYAGTATSGAFGAHLWRRSPLARLDTESGQGDAMKRSTQLVSASGPLACTKAGSAPWSCAPKPGLSLGDVGVVSPALVATLSSLDVSVGDDRILDQGVRCFTVARPTTTGAGAGADAAGGSAAELCLTSDGIPVRVVTGSTRLDAVSLARGRAPDSVFEPPTG